MFRYSLSDGAVDVGYHDLVVVSPAEHVTFTARGPLIRSRDAEHHLVHTFAQLQTRLKNNRLSKNSLGECFEILTIPSDESRSVFLKFAEFLLESDFVCDVSMLFSANPSSESSELCDPLYPSPPSSVKECSDVCVLTATP
jgi:hypothetical protein